VTDHPLVATASQTVGPFFHVGPGATSALGRMATGTTPGERITLRVSVLDGEAAPVPDALVELWQADSEGRYSTPVDSAGAPPDFSGFGRLGTDADGWCTFETVRPGVVAGTAQSPHVNVCLMARGLQRHLYTRLYFEGDSRLDSDPVLSAVEAGRRHTLVARQTAPSVWELVIRLQGDGETVFFDL
jgi:protocatechuate 3,4-dioxygenase alpha subunit